MIISIINQKGGVAKTTSTYNISALLAKKDKKVLMIDLDPQASLTVSVGIEPEELRRTIYNVICENEDITNIIIELDKNLYIAPSVIDLSIAELSLVNKIARESILKKKIEKVKNNFDYIIIDCPPSLGLLVVNALSASDKILIPVATDYLAYRGLRLLLSTVDNVKENINSELSILGVIATLFDRRTLHSREVLEILEDKYNVIGKISISVQVKDSILAGKPLVEYNPKHHIVDEYKQVVEVILNEQ